MKVRKWLPLFAVLVLVFSLAGCGSTSVTNDSASKEYAVEMETIASGSTSLSDGSIGTEALSSDRKWVITMDMSAETDDLDDLMTELDARTAELGGYCESRHIYNGSAYSSYSRYRSASLTVRIPADRVEEFTAQVSEVSNVVYSNQNLEDITLSYVATESRVNALNAEEARLLALMEQAETMSDLLEIESRLTDVRYELENVTSLLKVYNNQVEYATIYLDISEVREYTVVEEQTVWQRMGGGFADSLKGLGNLFVEIAVFLVAKLPYILAAAVPVTVAVIRIKKRKKKDS